MLTLLMNIGTETEKEQMHIDSFSAYQKVF